MMTVDQCFDRPSVLHNIFVDMNSVRSVKPVPPFYDENNAVACRQRFPRHMSVKRTATCPASHNMVAVPKRSRMHAVSNDLRCSNAQSLRSQSYMLAVPQSSAIQPNVCYTPTYGESRVNKRLAFAPLNNQTRQNASSCCVKENLCFGAFSGNQGVSTPPYGSNTDSFVGGKVKRRLSRKNLQSSTRKVKRSSSMKPAKVIGNAKAFSTNNNLSSKENITGALSKQPSAMIMYNTFLRQMESENEKKKYVENKNVSRDESRRYSPGFVPSLTSTPQKSPPNSKMSTPKASTVTSSGYCSRPSSEVSSTFKTDNGSVDDSFARFICFIEDGVLSTNKQFLNGNRNIKSVLDDAQSIKSDSALENSFSLNHIRQQKHHSNNNNTKRCVLTSTPVSQVSGHSTETRQLPSHPNIGAPLATSSPLHSNPWESARKMDAFVWRPWC